MSNSRYARGPGERPSGLERRQSERAPNGPPSPPLGSDPQRRLRRAYSVGATRAPTVGKPLDRGRWLATKVLATYEVRLEVTIDPLVCEGEPIVIEIFKGKNGADESVETQEQPSNAPTVGGTFTYALADGDLDGEMPTFFFKASAKGDTIESTRIPLEPLPDPFEELLWRVSTTEDVATEGLVGQKVDLYVRTNPISAPDGTSVTFEVFTHEPVEGEPEKVEELSICVADGGATATWTYTYEPPAEGEPYWRPQFTFKAKATIKDGREMTSDPSDPLPFLDRLEIQFVKEDDKQLAYKKHEVTLAPPDGGRARTFTVVKGALAETLLPGAWTLQSITPDKDIVTVTAGPLS